MQSGTQSFHSDYVWSRIYFNYLLQTFSTDKTCCSFRKRKGLLSLLHMRGYRIWLRQEQAHWCIFSCLMTYRLKCPLYRLEKLKEELSLSENYLCEYQNIKENPLKGHKLCELLAMDYGAEYKDMIKWMEKNRGEIDVPKYSHYILYNKAKRDRIIKNRAL